jgi:hypothetical protein
MGLGYMPHKSSAFGSGITNFCMFAGRTCVVQGGRGKCVGLFNGEWGYDYAKKYPSAQTVVSSGATATYCGQSGQCFIKNGERYCSGRNELGNLGAGARGYSNSAVKTKNLTNVEHFSLGAGNDMIVNNGDVYSVGWSGSNPLGAQPQLGTTAGAGYLAFWLSLLPTPVLGIPSKTKFVAGDGLGSCAVTVDNQLYCWGDRVIKPGSGQRRAR